jgi:hypothetical protein
MPESDHCLPWINRTISEQIKGLAAKSPPFASKELHVLYYTCMVLYIGPMRKIETDFARPVTLSPNEPGISPRSVDTSIVNIVPY